MGQNPNRTPGEHPNPTTKIGWKLGGAPTNQNGTIGFDNHSQVGTSSDQDPPPPPQQSSRPRVWPVLFAWFGFTLVGAGA